MQVKTASFVFVEGKREKNIRMTSSWHNLTMISVHKLKALAKLMDKECVQGRDVCMCMCVCQALADLRG